MRHYVNISKNVLAQFLLNGFESYVVQHNHIDRPGIEMFGSLYGTIAETRTTRHYDVEFMSIDTTADMQPGHAVVDSIAMQIKQRFAEAFGIVQLGTIHTHPYLNNEMSLLDVRAIGCMFSDGDMELFKDHAHEHGHVLHAVLTMRSQNNNNFKLDGFNRENIFEFCIARCKCFLNVGVFSIVDGELTAERTILKCDYLERFNYITDAGIVTQIGENGFEYVP